MTAPAGAVPPSLRTTAARPRRPDGHPRSVRIAVRVTPGEREALDAYAARFDLEVGSLLRTLALEVLLGQPGVTSVVPVGVPDAD